MGSMIELTSVFYIKPKQWPKILYPHSNPGSLFFDEMIHYYQGLLTCLDDQTLSDLITDLAIEGNDD
jgi:hypothetical protein